jgi:hypothetical protein
MRDEVVDVHGIGGGRFQLLPGLPCGVQDLTIGFGNIGEPLCVLGFLLLQFGMTGVA